MLRLAPLLLAPLLLGTTSSAPAPSPDGVERLLDALPDRDVQDVLDALGPPPPMDGLLAPDQDIPLLQLEFAPDALTAARDLFRSAETDLRSGAVEAARDKSREALAQAEAALPGGYPLLADLRLLARDAEYLLALPEVEREAAIAAYGGLGRAARDVRDASSIEPLALALTEYLAHFPEVNDTFCSGLGSLAVLRYQTGKPADAERLAVNAVLFGLENQGVLHSATSKGLGNLAFFLTAARRYPEAEAIYAHTLELRRRLDGTDSLDYANVLFNLAQLLRTSRHEEAEALLARVLELRLDHGDRPVSIGITRSQLGYVLRLQGRFDEARSELEAALLLFDEGLPKDHHERAQALQHLLIVERDTGHYDAAAEYGAIAIAMYERLFPDGSPLTAHANLVMASLELRRGQLDEAERRVREAELVFGRFVPESHAYMVETRATFAAVLRAKGDTAGASEALVANLDARRAQFGPVSRMVADDLSSLAELALERGDLEAALQHADEEIAILVEIAGEVHPRTADARVRRAQVLFLSERLEEARDELARARLALGNADPEDSGTQRVTRARADWITGQVLVALDAPSAALDLYLDGYAGLLRVDPTHPLLVEVALDLGELRYDLGDPEGAASAFEEALSIAESLRVRVLGDELDRATYAERLSLDRASRALVRARTKAGDPLGALDAAERGRGRALLDLLARSGSDLIRPSGTADPAPTAALATRLLAEQEARRELVKTEEAMRKRRARATRSNEPATEELAADLERVAARRRALREASAAVARELTALYPSAKAASAVAVLDALGEGEDLLHYTIGERSAVLLTTLGGAQLEAFQIAEGTEEVAALRTEVVAVIELFRSGAEVPPERLAALSTQLLPADLQEELTLSSRVVLVPDGPLHGLPFEALALGSSSWLAVGPPAAYAPSGSLLVHTRSSNRRRNSTHASSEVRTALVLGAPTFTGARTSNSTPSGRALSEIDTVRLFGDRLRPLPGTAAEARQVAARLTAQGYQVTQRLGDDASELALRAHTGADVLHIATHGFRAPAERPYEAAVALRTPAQPTLQDDGFLTLDELVRDWGDTLLNCELVTLSACDTSAGTEIGDSVVSLSWGFFHAGAESVLVSLWKVDDFATLLFMDRFYALWTEGAPKAEALADARRYLAQSPPAENRLRLAELGVVAEQGGNRSAQDGFPRPGADPESRETLARYDFRSPRYWAAFVLFGDAE